MSLWFGHVGALPVWLYGPGWPLYEVLALHLISGLNTYYAKAGTSQALLRPRTRAAEL